MPLDRSSELNLKKELSFDMTYIGPKIFGFRNFVSIFLYINIDKKHKYFIGIVTADLEIDI